MNSNDNSKRIVKNTLLLYFRMMITMLVGAYTSRVILNTLGIENYGIYNVVGGVVTMFSFFSVSLSSAISRYITFELGRGYSEKLKNIFSTSLNFMIAMALFMLVIIEIVGIWFLNNHLNIPEGKIDAAIWILHFAILSFVVTIISVPFNSAIIAHERMNVFAYFSIAEVSLKLVIVYMLCISPYDKLKTYAMLFFCVTLLMSLIYAWYCILHFKECQYKPIFDKSLFKEISGFAGWNMTGSAAYIFNTQGINITMNLFFGVTVNAARGIAMQVEGIVKQFVLNFTTALNPQIIKSYANGNIEYMNTLVCQGAKYSYMLMLFFTIPIVFEADLILKLWLKIVPDYAPLFVRLTLIGAMMDMMGNSTANACWATGKVKRYYIYVSSVGCLPFVLTVIAFYIGLPVYWAYIIFIAVYAMMIFVKLYILKGLMDFPIMMFIHEVIYRVYMVSIMSVIPPMIVWWGMDESFLRLIYVGLVSVISVLACIYIVGIGKNERELLLGIIQKRLHVK